MKTKNTREIKVITSNDRINTNKEDIQDHTLPPLEELDEVDLEYLLENQRDFEASPPDVLRQTKYPALRGLDVPSRACGKMSKIDRERWVVVVERLMGRGILSIKELAIITGLHPRAVYVIVENIKAAWAKTLTTGQVNIRREKLYYEADRVSEEAWNMYNDPDASLASKAVAMKLILDANKRKGSLIGAERIEVQVDTNTEENNKVPAEIERDLEKRMGVSEGFLSALGKQISRSITEEKNREEKEEDQAWNNYIEKRAADEATKTKTIIDAEEDDNE
jgi:hypothetical protein